MTCAHAVRFVTGLPGRLTAVVLASLAVVSIAPANTISQSLDFRLNSQNAAASLAYDPFNVSLGTLQGIDITFTATRRHAWGIWNVSNTNSSVPYDVTLKNTTLTLDSNLFGFDDLHYGPGVTPVLSSVLPSTVSSELTSGRSAFLLGLDPLFPSAFQPATTLTALSGSFLPSLAFTGTLNLAYSFNPGIFHIDSNNFRSGSLVDVYGTATVTYTYLSVADSPLGATVGVLWIAMIVVARIRRGKLAE